MKRKHSIGRFIVVAILCAILLIFTVCSFAMFGDSRDSDFVGFARAVNLGVEFRGGTVQEYGVQSNTTQNKSISDGVSANVTRIRYLLENEGYDVNVYKNGNNLVIEFLDDYSPVDIQNIISKKVDFGVKKSSSDTESLLTAQDVESAYASTSADTAYFVINFTKDGASKFQEVISNGSGYFTIGSNNFTLSNLSGANSSAVSITVGSLDTAKYYASQVESSKYDLSFDMQNQTVFSVADAQKNTILLVCLVIVLFVACSAILIAVFKKLGLIGAFTLLIGLLLQIVLLQAIPAEVFTLTGPAMFASLLCMLLGALSIYVIYDKMHQEYKLGKILPASVNFGFKKIWPTILDIHLALIVPAIVTYFAGSYLVKQFAMALMCGLFVYGVVTIVLTLFFTKWFTYISFKNKDYGFKREAHIDELK